MYSDEKKSFKKVEMNGAKKIACSVETNEDNDLTNPRMTVLNAHNIPDANPLNIIF